MLENSIGFIIIFWGYEIWYYLWNGHQADGHYDLACGIDPAYGPGAQLSEVSRWEQVLVARLLTAWGGPLNEVVYHERLRHDFQPFFLFHLLIH